MPDLRVTISKIGIRIHLLKNENDAVLKYEDLPDYRLIMTKREGLSVFIRLPADADHLFARGKLASGVLSISLPKLEDIDATEVNLEVEEDLELIPLPPVT